VSPAIADTAVAAISRERLVEVVAAMVDIPSPTGDERPLAEALVGWMDTAGIEANLQPIDATQANAWGRIRGDRTGSDLMLYAPIDTWSTGDPTIDVPFVGPRVRPDMTPHAQVTADTVVGLGAMNPKGHAACNLVAAEVLRAAKVPLRGDLLVAFGAGGMPTNAYDDRPRRNVGQGVGASFLLEQGVWPDHAIISKSFWGVNRQEVGLAWLDVTVHGLHSYVGARHRLPDDNPIVTAAALVAIIDEWLLAWPGAHQVGETLPQGAISAIDGGLSRMVSGIPASCRMRLDVRLAPGTSPLDARRGLAEHLAAHAPGDAQIDVDLALAIPGSETPADTEIYRETVAAWESIEGRTHQPPTQQSGATDANILRNRGIPTVRIGLPKVQVEGQELDYAGGMNTVDIAAMVRLTELLVRVAVATCTRTRPSARTV
jgi:acetylornithine deacetylase/succinyl-diaminopimelate desuccinylase-like protein